MAIRFWDSIAFGALSQNTKRLLFSNLNKAMHSSITVQLLPLPVDVYKATCLVIRIHPNTHSRELAEQAPCR